MQCQMLHDKNLAKPFNDTFASGVVVKHGGYEQPDAGSSCGAKRGHLKRLTCSLSHQRPDAERHDGCVISGSGGASGSRRLGAPPVHGYSELVPNQLDTG